MKKASSNRDRLREFNQCADDLIELANEKFTKTILVHQILLNLCQVGPDGQLARRHRAFIAA